MKRKERVRRMRKLGEDLSIIRELREFIPPYSPDHAEKMAGFDRWEKPIKEELFRLMEKELK